MSDHRLATPRLMTPDEAFAMANSCLQDGRFAEADDLYKQLVVAFPEQPDLLHFAGLCKHRLGDRPGAIGLLQAAIAINPNDAVFHFNLGIVLQELNRFEDALACHAAALAIKPDFLDALNAQANVLCLLGKLDEALVGYRSILSVNPEFLSAIYNYGLVCRTLGQLDEALRSFGRVLTYQPDNAVVLASRGEIFHQQNRNAEALADFNRALAIDRNSLSASFGRALIFLGQDRLKEAAEGFYHAISLDPRHAKAYFNLAVVLVMSEQWDGALYAFDKAIEIDQSIPYAHGYRLYARMHVCNWFDFDTSCRTLFAQIEQGERVCAPFPLLAFPATAQLQKRCAEIYIADRYPEMATSTRMTTKQARDRIRLGYLSADFHNHATAYLMASLFEIHDRSSFEVIGISYGQNVKDEMRSRLLEAFDTFLDISDRSDDEAVADIRNLDIDIAIDLKGFTRGFRLGLLARRVAPIQVSYLGYPGTMGAPYIDYLVADREVIPDALRDCFSEKIVRLPTCYQVNDASRARPARLHSREQVGLAEEDFVFCCFNNNYKITPDVFEIWMSIMRQIGRSVLWLLEDNPTASLNLRRAAVRAGISEQRLVFAQRTDQETHLSRHYLADLFLDTFVCNAHTTASDALWMGVPLVTLEGETFHSRVAASLLHSLGVPELIARTPSEYEQIVIALAGNPNELARVRQRVSKNRTTSALFDTRSFAGNLETAYRMMWMRHQAGQRPDHLDLA